MRKERAAALIDWITVACIVLYCIRYTQFVPVTGDDFNSLIDSSSNYWTGGNRIWWIVTAPIAESVTRWLLTVRFVHGVHILAALVPILVLAYYLRRNGLRTESRLSILLLLSVKVIGQEHTAPLAYPISYSIALGLSIGGGLLSGVIGGENGRGSLLKYSLAAICILPSLWYEYYPAVFCVTHLWAAKDARGRITSRDIKVSVIPLLAMVTAKLVGYIIGSADPGFNTYDGTKLGVEALSVSYAAKSAVIASQMLAGNLVYQHTQSLMTWPPIANIGSYGSISIAYGLLITIASISSIWETISKNNQSNSELRRLSSNACNATAIMTLVQLAPHALSGKYHEWFGDRGFGSGYTYLNGSLAMSTAACLAGVLLARFTRIGIAREKIGGIHWITAITTSAGLGFSAVANYHHNEQVADIMNKRASNLESVVSLCPDLSLRPDAYQEQSRKTFPVNPPSGMEPLYLDTTGSLTAGEAICKAKRAHQQMFGRWQRRDQPRADMIGQRISGVPWNEVRLQDVFDAITTASRNNWYGYERKGAEPEAAGFKWAKMKLGEEAVLKSPISRQDIETGGGLDGAGGMVLYVQKAKGYDTVVLSATNQEEGAGDRIIALRNDKRVELSSLSSLGITTLRVVGASKKTNRKQGSGSAGVVTLGESDQRTSFFRLIAVRND